MRTEDASSKDGFLPELPGRMDGIVGSITSQQTRTLRWLDDYDYEGTYPPPVRRDAVVERRTHYNPAAFFLDVISDPAFNPPLQGIGSKHFLVHEEGDTQSRIMYFARALSDPSKNNRYTMAVYTALMPQADAAQLLNAVRQQPQAMEVFLAHPGVTASMDEMQRVRSDELCIVQPSAINRVSLKRHTTEEGGYPNICDAVDQQGYFLAHQIGKNRGSVIIRLPYGKDGIGSLITYGVTSPTEMWTSEEDSG